MAQFWHSSIQRYFNLFRLWLIDYGKFMSQVSFWATAIEEGPLTRLFHFYDSLNLIYNLRDVQVVNSRSQSANQDEDRPGTSDQLGAFGARKKCDCVSRVFTNEIPCETIRNMCVPFANRTVTSRFGRTVTYCWVKFEPWLHEENNSIGCNGDNTVDN